MYYFTQPLEPVFVPLQNPKKWCLHHYTHPKNGACNIVQDPQNYGLHYHTRPSEMVVVPLYTNLRTGVCISIQDPQNWYFYNHIRSSKLVFAPPPPPQTSLRTGLCTTPNYLHHLPSHSSPPTYVHHTTPAAELMLVWQSCRIVRSRLGPSKLSSYNSKRLNQVITAFRTRICA